MNQILFKRYSDQFPINVKISFYNSTNIDTFDSPVNNDSLFSYLLSQLVLANMTRHILLPVMNVDININDIDKLIKEEDYYKNIKDKLQNNIIVDKCCLQLREHFFKTTLLSDYYNEVNCSECIKPLLFQVIHTLATIQKEFINFRHNNMKLHNILIYLRKDPSVSVMYNGFKDDNFYLSNFPFDIKISNF
jgi:hypothetical protein